MCVCLVVIIFFFKQKTAYEMRISDWSSDVCSSDLPTRCLDRYAAPRLSALCPCRPCPPRRSDSSGGVDRRGDGHTRNPGRDGRVAAVEAPGLRSGSLPAWFCCGQPCTPGSNARGARPHLLGGEREGMRQIGRGACRETEVRGVEMWE